MLAPDKAEVVLLCSVSTFIGGTEDPEKGCRISSPQPPPPSIQYDQGVGPTLASSCFSIATMSRLTMKYSVELAISSNAAQLLLHS